MGQQAVDRRLRPIIGRLPREPVDGASGSGDAIAAPAGQTSCVASVERQAVRSDPLLPHARFDPGRRGCCAEPFHGPFGRGSRCRIRMATGSRCTSVINRCSGHRRADSRLIVRVAAVSRFAMSGCVDRSATRGLRGHPPPNWSSRSARRPTELDRCTHHRRHTRRRRPRLAAVVA